MENTLELPLKIKLMNTLKQFVSISVTLFHIQSLIVFIYSVDLMTRGPANPLGKILIIGGGIANFTNVAATFKGIITALKEFQHKLQEHKVRIFVRRGGPNYQEGLKAMTLLGETLGVEIQVQVILSNLLENNKCANRLPILFFIF